MRISPSRPLPEPTPRELEEFELQTELRQWKENWRERDYWRNEYWRRYHRPRRQPLYD